MSLTLDCGLTGAIENEFDLSRLDDLTETEPSNPDKWLALSCGAHNLSNLSEKFLKKFLPTELAKCSSVNFAEEWKKITEFIHSCSHKCNRQNPDLPKSYNQFIYEECPSEEAKLQIAKIKFADFEQKDDEEQKEILSSIHRYPQIHKISKIRFRDVLDALKKVAMNKTMIQAISVRSHRANEYVKNGDLNWALIENLIEVLTIARKHLNYHENSSASILMHLQSLLDIISETLNVKDAVNEM